MSACGTNNSAPDRIERPLRDWNITAEETRQTGTSILVFGRRNGQPVVLKVLRAPGDEWHAGKVLQAFDSRGVVRVYEQLEGAVLLERIVPGTSLASTELAGGDVAATDIVAEVILRMGSPEPPDWSSRVEDWASGFERYLKGGDRRIPDGLVKQVRELYLQLCASQTERRLLHADLHHDNILLDANRGWVAVDPKGVVGEKEYEIGAALRNPIERLDLFVSREVVQRRIEQYKRALDLDAQRVLRWAFAQAVLSVIWSWEDGVESNEPNPVLRLALEMRTMIDGPKM